MKPYPRLEAIFRQASQRALQHIHIAMGELIPFTETQLREQWAQLAKNTPLEGAELRFRMIPAEQQCMWCFLVYRPHKGETTCPQCKAVGAKILKGEELYLDEA